MSAKATYLLEQQLFTGNQVTLCKIVTLRIVKVRIGISPFHVLFIYLTGATPTSGVIHGVCINSDGTRSYQPINTYRDYI